MSSKSVSQECLAEVSHRSVSQKVSNQFFARRCLARVPHQSAPPECPTRVPPPECPLTVTKILAEIVQEWQSFGIVFLHDVCSQLVMCIRLKRVLSRFHLFWSINDHQWTVLSTTLSGCVWYSSWASCRGRMSPSLEFLRRFAGMYGHPVHLRVKRMWGKTAQIFGFLPQKKTCFRSLLNVPCASK